MTPHRVSHELLRRVGPRLPLLARAVAHVTWGEAELRLLPALCDRDRISVDVGSGFGVYAAIMLLYSRQVLAFEPDPRRYRLLRGSFAPAVAVKNCALSDRAGSAALRVPVVAGRAFVGRASIEPENGFGGHRRAAAVAVETRTLDSFALGAVGLIKIDVEGHELAVLRGARETLVRHRPNLIIESERRHHPDCPDRMFAVLASLGYRGFFLLDRRLVAVDGFDRRKHQQPGSVGWCGKSPAGLYINNFIFVHEQADLDRLKATLGKDAVGAAAATAAEKEVPHARDDRLRGGPCP
ncbi:FkbM family methyltransferase [Rhodospirillaceae bacterium SYSU D60014]|uniref:FkbM family methyltransferase n=1 Tax=Virgifigura deserti TaxID=2268457 RepID=UPI0013C3F7C3